MKLTLSLSVSGEWESVEECLLLALTQLRDPVIRSCGLHVELNNSVANGFVNIGTYEGNKEQKKIIEESCTRLISTLDNSVQDC